MTEEQEETPDESDAPASEEDPKGRLPSARPKKKKPKKQARHKSKGGRKAKPNGSARADTRNAREEETPDPEPVENVPPRSIWGMSVPRFATRAIGATVALLGFVGTFLFMANKEQVTRGPLYGLITFTLGAIGLVVALDLGASDEGPRRSLLETPLFARPKELWVLSPIVTFPIALALLAIGAAVGGYDGLPITILVALVPIVFSAFRRPALLVVAVAGYLYLPFLGVYGLWDPWETHYGEVAREMLARDDWLSLWWAQEDWFWSKPILIFWSEGLSMGIFGVDYMPDANPAHPEWAIRLPHFFLTLGALLGVYALVSKIWSRRAGVLAAIVVATVPHFALLSHQAITDMPFVANMTMAMSFLGLSICEDPEREVTRYGIGPFTVSARHLVVLVLSAVVLPQVLYLASRNVEFNPAFPPFGWHYDEFMSGSGHNTLPEIEVAGNRQSQVTLPFFSGPAAQPIVQGLVWLIGYVATLLLLRREKRSQPLLMVGFYLFAGLAFMSKGIPGFALPGLVALFFLIVSRRWDLLLEGRLRVALGTLIVLTTGLPWYVSMYIRHGSPFLERLLIHDHLNRLTAGVHGDNASIEYFIEQLGYGLFPWIALAPLALVVWLGARTAREGRTSSPSAAPRALPDVDLDKARYALVTYVPRLGFFGIGLGTVGAGLFVRYREEGSGWVGFALLVVGLVLIALAAFAYFGARDGDVATAPPSEITLDEEGRLRSQKHVSLLLVLWAAAAFTLFSAMTTKFHHYIFPAVVPVAMLIGLALEGLLNRTRLPRWRRFAGTALAMLATVPLVVGVAGYFGDVRGVIPVEPDPATDWVLAHPWPGVEVAGTIGLGLVMLLGALLVLQRETSPDAEPARTFGLARGAVTTALFAAPPLIAIVGRDLSWVTDSRPQGYERLIQLFVYNYERPWPTELDYRPILTGFAIVATSIALLAAWKPVRDVAVRAFLGVALLFTVWALDVYIPDLSPHWGQRELFQEYYRRRGGPEEPIVAYQMNWKGENFYTGNRVHVFVDLDNQALRNWVNEHRGQAVWVVLERSRLAGMRSAMRDAVIEEITDDRLCNKFILIRAQLGPATPAVTPIDQRH